MLALTVGIRNAGCSALDLVLEYCLCVNVCTKPWEGLIELGQSFERDERPDNMLKDIVN